MRRTIVHLTIVPKSSSDCKNSCSVRRMTVCLSFVVDCFNCEALDFVVFILVTIRLHCGLEVKNAMIFDVNVVVFVRCRL